MESFYRPATREDAGECVNMIPLSTGAMQTIVPTKNAVIVQLFEIFNDDNERAVHRVVSIECKDESFYPELKDEALRILRII